MKKLLWIICIFVFTIGITMWWQTNTTTDSVSQNQKNDTGIVAEIPTDPIPLEEKIGQLFIIGHWIGTPIASTTELIVKHNLGGIIIMGNAEKTTTTKEWVDTWQDASKTPLIVSVDQEGGVVTRYKQENFTQTSQREITDSKTAYETGYKRGSELKSLGINMNFAPVLDSAKNPDSFMYERVFKNRAESATLAASMVKGMKAAGVTGVVKHFPGHDDTNVDSHFSLPIVDIPKNQLDDFTSPFIEIIKNNTPEAIMTAHVLFPKIDSLPATLSKFFLTDYLRTKLGFTGVIITDDMSMNAIDSNWSSTEASIKTIVAGADIVLFAAEPELVSGAIEAVKQAVKNGGISEKRVDDSYERIMLIKQ